MCRTAAGHRGAIFSFVKHLHCRHRKQSKRCVNKAVTVKKDQVPAADEKNKTLRTNLFKEP